MLPVLWEKPGGRSAGGRAQVALWGVLCGGHSVGSSLRGTGHSASSSLRLLPAHSLEKAASSVAGLRS